MLRKLVPLIALALAATACSADSVTGPAAQKQPPTQARHTGGMMGGGG